MKSVGVLTVANDALAVGIRGRKEVEWLECRPCSSGVPLPELADVLLARKELRAVGGVQVLLDPTLVQLRTLHSIPPVPARRLPDLIRAQTKKFFRVNGTEVVVDAAWIDAGPGERTVRAVAADLELIRSLEAAVERTGLRLLGISPGGSGAEQRLILESQEGRVKRRRRGWMELLPYGAVAALVWSGAAGLYVGDLLLDRAALRQETVVVRTHVDQMSAVRTGIAGFAPVASAVTAQGPAQAWATRLLAAVAEALPDSAHILHLEASRDRGTTLELRASDPVGVIEALSAALGGAASLAGPPREELLDGRRWYRAVVRLGAVNEPS